MQTQSSIRRAALLLFLPFLGLRASAAPEPENPYDALAKTLNPLVHLFADSDKPPGSAEIQLTVIEAAALPPELKGLHLTLHLVRPDRLRLEATWEGGSITICRNRQQVWASPRATAQQFLDAMPKPKKHHEDDEVTADIPPLILPIPEKQLTLLPALFQVRDLGLESLAGGETRHLHVELMPELARGLGAKAWTGEVWINADHQPVQISAASTGPDSDPYTLRFAKVAYDAPIAEEVWTPGDDSLVIPPARYLPLLERLGQLLSGHAN